MALDELPKPDRSHPFPWIGLALLIAIGAGIYSFAEARTLSNWLVLPPRSYLTALLSVAGFLWATWLIARKV